MPHISFNAYDDDGETITKQVEAHYIVCPTCQGNGAHVNRAIDGHGITGEEMDELGEEFYDDYMGGTYDVTCEECNGDRVVLEATEGGKNYKEYQDKLRDDWEYEQMVAMERRCGA